MSSPVQLFVVAEDRSVLNALQSLLGGKVELVRLPRVELLITESATARRDLGLFIDAAAMGNDLAALLRVRAVRPMLPTALLLGDEDFTLGIEAVHAGACDSTLYKPLTADALRGCIGQMVAARKSAAVAA